MAPLSEPAPLELSDPHLIESTDGVSLAVYDLGGEGPDIVFAHATGFCAGVFLPIMARLGGTRLVAVDFRGHGRSGIPATSMDWSGTASDLLVTVEELALDRPFGIGHSMGGAALALAEERRPGTFGGMWLYEPIIFPPDLREPAGPNPLAQGALRRRSTFDSAGDAVANFASKPPFDALHPDALAAYVRYGFAENPDGTVELRCRPETESQTYEMGPRHDAFDHLAKILCPVTVLRGVEHPMTPAQLSPLIADAIPRGKLEDHPELGHFGPLEDPGAMAESIQLAVTAAS